MITFGDRFSVLKGEWDNRLTKAEVLVPQYEKLIEDMLSQYDAAERNLLEARAAVLYRRTAEEVRHRLEPPSPQAIMDIWFVRAVDVTLALMRQKPETRDQAAHVENVRDAFMSTGLFPSGEAGRKAREKDEEFSRKHDLDREQW